MLDLHFTVLKCTGVWRPTNLSKSWDIAHRIHSCITVTSMYLLVSSQLARLVTAQSFDEFNDTFFVGLANINGVIKGTCYIVNRNRILELMRMLENDPCAPRDDFEKDLLRKCEEFCRKIVVILLSLVNVTLTGFIIAPFYAGIENRELPYKVKIPYSVDNLLYFWLTFAFHIFTALLFVFTLTTNNAVIASFMVQICAQFEVLQHRFDEFPGRVAKAVGSGTSAIGARIIERDLFNRLVRHHQHIFRLTDLMSGTFNWVIICQYYGSAILICISVYQTAIRSTNIIELLWFSLFLACTLGEFFVYCYFGNEISLKSADMRNSIYKIDWTSLSNELRKDLAFIILQSSRPIEISYGSFATLTLDSFVNIVKASYSFFNVLKTSA